MRNDYSANILISLWMFLTFSTATASAVQPITPAPKDKSQTPRTSIPEDSDKWHRDPFGGGSAKKGKPLAPGGIPAGLKNSAVAANTPELTVQGIMQANNAFHALINGRVVKTGDKLEGLTIKEISRYQVIVQSDRKEKIIYDIYQGRIDRGKK